MLRNYGQYYGSSPAMEGRAILLEQAIFWIHFARNIFRTMDLGRCRFTNRPDIKNIALPRRAMCLCFQSCKAGTCFQIAFCCHWEFPNTHISNHNSRRGFVMGINMTSSCLLYNLCPPNPALNASLTFSSVRPIRKVACYL